MSSINLSFCVPKKDKVLNHILWWQIFKKQPKGMLNLI